LVVGSGCLHSGPTTLFFHTDFGPASQDKEMNQDYALAWSGDPSPGAPEPLLALALADGVTSSYRSEWASELACAVALQVLVEQLAPSPAISRASAAAGIEIAQPKNGGPLPPVSPSEREKIPTETGDGGTDIAPIRYRHSHPSALDLVKNAFASAARALQEVTKGLEAKPEASCPPGQFLPTWKYILRKGVLLQTTLILAWLQDGQFRLAMIGDGGLLWRNRMPGAAPVDEVLAEADLATNEVHVLGPRSPEPALFDLWVERPWSGSLTCAIYSDGVGRGIQKASVALLNRLTELQAQGCANPSREFIRQAAEARDPAFDDNLTLAFLRRD
jgi:hypothetical protein